MTWSHDVSLSSIRVWIIWIGFACADISPWAFGKEDPSPRSGVSMPRLNWPRRASENTFPPFLPTRMVRARSAFSLPYTARDVHRCTLGFLGEKRFNNRYNLFNKCQTVQTNYLLSTFTSCVLEGAGSPNLNHRLSSRSCFFSPDIIYLCFLFFPPLITFARDIFLSLTFLKNRVLALRIFSDGRLFSVHWFLAVSSLFLSFCSPWAWLFSSFSRQKHSSLVFSLFSFKMCTRQAINFPPHTALTVFLSVNVSRFR